MNITVDKPRTILALQNAERILLNAGHEEDATMVAALLVQIKTHGKGGENESTTANTN